MMRILVLTDHYPPFYRGGYELMCKKVIDGLSARGHKITVLTSTCGLKKQDVDDGVYRIFRLMSSNNHRRLLPYRIGQLKHFFQARENYAMALNLARTIKFDLVFVWHMLGTSISPIFACQDIGCQTVYRIGSHWLIHCKESYADESSFLKRFYRSALIGFKRFEDLNIDSAIVVSNSLLESHYQAGLNIKNVSVIPSGITEEWINPRVTLRQSPTDQLRILYVGRLEEEKGVEIALNAIKLLVTVRGFKNILLNMVGDGKAEYIRKLNRFISSSNLESKVNLIGFLPHSKLSQCYKKHDVLLLPTLRLEGFPMTIVEAMAHGLTVIASKIGGPKDAIMDGYNGFLIPPGKPYELATTIEKVITMPPLAEAIGSTAIQTVRSNYRADVMLDRYEAFLEALV